MNFYHFFFYPSTGPWYSGNVWGNMVAWVICGVIAVLWGRRKFIKWNRKRERVDQERHEDMKRHITKKHEELKAHITKVHNGKK